MSDPGPVTLEQLAVDPYAALGVRTIINATCHHTIYGGSLLPEVSKTALNAASTSAVDMMELQRAAGRVISQYTHADDGFIVSGCAAAMMVGAAAVLTGTDPAKMEQLPDTTGMKNLCVAKRFSREIGPDGNEYIDHSYAIAVQTAGMRFVEVGEGDIVTPEQFEAGFSDDVAMVYWIGHAPLGDIAIEDVISIAHSHGVPVMVDCSNVLPPRENLHRFIDIGADLVCFSGGKGLQGPQGAGIIAGRADLIEAVGLQSAPNHGIGRICKVSKEEIVAQVTSLVWWAEQDEEARMTEHHRLSNLLLNQIADLHGASAEVVFPDYQQRPYPTVHVRLAPETGMSGADLRRELHAGDPAIASMSHHSDADTIRLDVRLLEESEIAAITGRLHEILGGDTGNG